jgi:hypothetical protein
MMRARAGRLIVPMLVAALWAPPAWTQTQTSKERLSDKASDNQRLDNCRVAPERRGTEPRPDCGQSAEQGRPTPPGDEGRAAPRRN